MKLIICLFLIVVILEEYNCAPYVRTKGRHRHHHHHHNHRPSRSHTAYRCRLYCSSYNGHYRSRYNPHTGCRYGSSYGTRHFIQNITPVHKTVEKPVTVEKPMNKTVDQSMIIDESMIVNKTVAVHNHVAVEKPEAKSAKSVAVDKPVTVINHTEMPVNKPQDVAVDDSVGRTVYPSVERPEEKPVTVNKAVTVDKPVAVDKPAAIEKPIEKPVNVQKPVTDRTIYPSAYSTVNPLDDMPTENILDIATEYPFTVTRILP